MFKRLFGAVFAILEVIGISAVVGYGLEAGKDSFNRHKKSKEESKGHN
mgnify:CR=1 FL=1